MFCCKTMIFALLCMLLTASQAEAAKPMTDANAAEILRQLFKERPDIVLDVLRQNSEIVLDIAQQGSGARRKRNLEAQWKEDLKHPKKAAQEGRPAQGPENAPVTIMAFSDFSCPYCEQGAHTIASIRDAYGDKVRYIFKHTPLGKDSVARLASEYYLATGMQSEEKAWKMYTTFFSNRERLMAEGEPFMQQTAQKLDVNMQKLATDVKSKKIKALVDEDLTDAKQLGVEGTPYFLINDLVVRGALPFEFFKDAVDMALQHANKK